MGAFKGNENKKLMETPGIKDRLGSVGNQFAVTSILAFLMSIPVMIAKEGSKFGPFLEMCKTTPAVWVNMVASGLWFYGYNELATMTLKKTGAVTQSVANTAKRVIVIVGVALVLGESLDPIKLLGVLLELEVFSCIPLLTILSRSSSFSPGIYCAKLYFFVDLSYWYYASYTCNF